MIEDYKAVMQKATPGFGADVYLAEDEDKRMVRQNLKAAADELHIALDFRPRKDPRRMHFRFITLEEKAAQPKRAGRPGKNQRTEDAEVEQAA